MHGAPVLRLRGRLLPLVFLASELGGEVTEARSHHVVVLQADDRRFGLVVDSVTDSAEIVVKPVGAYLKGVDMFAGATILGDGSVGLILDVLGLARRAHVLTKAQERELATLSTTRTSRRPRACRCWCSPITRAGGWRSRWSSSPVSRSSPAPSSRARGRSRSCSTARRSCTWSTSRG